MRSPDFLCVGAARAGTTSLHYYLRQHPELFIPGRKEPCFFSFAGEKIDYKKGKFAFALTSPDKYFQLFQNAREDQICGEISTPYLYLYQKTISNIMRFHPNHRKLKILILLRNPVSRAFSQYMWRVRDGREDLSFEEAIEQEAERMKLNYSFDYFYLDRGMYFQQVKAYIDSFRSVKIILHDDLVKDTEGMMRVICRFLEVDSHFVFDIEKEHNSSYPPRWELLGKLVTSESRLKFHLLNQLPDRWKKGIRHQFDRWNTDKNASIELKPETRKNLRLVYAEDLLRLQDLIGRDLSGWLKDDGR